MFDAVTDSGVGTRAATATMAEIREAVAAYAAAFDPALLSAADAQRVVDDAVAAEHMLATVKGLAARRVASTELWRAEGDRSAAHHLARKAGTSVTKAKEAIETAGRLERLPALDAAVRRGELSPAQAAPIADAATANPAAEERLVESAKRSSLGELLDECARTKAAAEPDDEARHRAVHASRHLRRRRCGDGAGELHYRSTLEEVAEVFSVIEGYADQEFRRARAEGRREPAEAYLADGLLAAARAAAARPGEAPARAGEGKAGKAGGCGDESTTTAGGAPADGTTTASGGARPADGTTTASGGARPVDGSSTTPGCAPADGSSTAPGSAPSDGSSGRPTAGTAGTGHRRPQPTKVVVRVDLDALLRGWPTDGEVCEIAGWGPMPVSAVRAMIESGNPFLVAVATKGRDVVNVAHLGRRPTAHQMSALEWLHPSCTVLGCNATARLEVDHRLPWSDTKITLLRYLDLPCSHHHRLKTYEGWALVEGVGKRPMVPPDDPRHPDYRGPGPPGRDDEEG